MLNLPEEIAEQKFSDVGVLSYRKDDIITFELQDGKSEQTLNSMKKDLAFFKEWANGKKLGFIVDSRKFENFGSEARIYAQKYSPHFSSKYAIIISSGMSSFLANMFIYINRPSIPTKTFTSKEDAINWITNE